MNKKIIGGMVVALIVLGIVVVSSGNSAPAGKPTVKIGIALPLTGNVAFLGEPSRKSAELALKDAGVTKYNYELVFEDTQFSPKIAASAASKLINIDKVLAIINFGSGTGNAISPISEAAKVAHFSLASDPTVAVGEYNYIHWTPPFKEGELLASELVKRGYKTVSIIDVNHPGPMAVTSAIRESLKSTDIKTLSYDLTNIGDKDFKTTIAKIKKANPDIIIITVFSPEIELFVKQMRELGLNTPVTSAETFEWSDQPQLFEGDWFISDALTPNFNEKYKAAYGTDSKPGSSYVYDLVSLLIRIQENSNEPIQAKDLPSIINQIGYDDSPIFGKIKIDKDGFFITDASVKIIKNGKGEVINQK